MKNDNRPWTRIKGLFMAIETNDQSPHTCRLQWAMVAVVAWGVTLFGAAALLTAISRF